ncbi:MAG TPA: DUF4956 domain-containing protein [Gemmataceae bacterium]|nr:DUF4956 domain-containing protein [Gemmataceae bacterium]
MLDWLQQDLFNGQELSFELLRKWSVRLLAAFVLGCIVAAVHYLTAHREGRRTDRPLLATLVLLALLIALLTIVIGDSQARAFTLVGSLAIVRFRTVVEDTRDTAFVIFAVGGGMAAGTGYPHVALLCSPLVLLGAWLFRPRRKRPAPVEGILVLRLAAGRPPDERIQALLNQHLRGYRLTGAGTARGGSALDATYTVQLPAPEQVFTLITELTRLEGVQSVELKED